MACDTRHGSRILSTVEASLDYISILLDERKTECHYNGIHAKMLGIMGNRMKKDLRFSGHFFGFSQIDLITYH